MNRRNQSDNADRKLARAFFTMTCEIGREMDTETSVITLATYVGGQTPRILDMGMAPGGFTATVLEKHPAATIRGITLPRAVGGLEVMLPHWRSDSRVRIEFADVTMLTDDMGRPATSVPATHPDFVNLSSDRPFQNETFDLIFCGAAVQRTQPRAEYRESRERLRLVTSQLIVALQRLRDNGALILLMHKAEAWETIQIISMFTKFSNVRLFKPRKKHAVRSSFYMITTNVRPRSEEAQSAVLEWRTQWESATFGSDSTLPSRPRVSGDHVCDLLAEFGPQLIDLATPVWKIQADGLRSASFLKKKSD
jgi:23S rRNA U2552 (ribose-2'-O)-methylase RlmE/FtsJ